MCLRVTTRTKYSPDNASRFRNTPCYRGMESHSRIAQERIEFFICMRLARLSQIPSWLWLCASYDPALRGSRDRHPFFGTPSLCHRGQTIALRYLCHRGQTIALRCGSSAKLGRTAAQPCRVPNQHGEEARLHIGPKA
jgi:hypothetical protein